MTKDWEINYVPDYGDIESALLDRGLIPTTEVIYTGDPDGRYERVITATRACLGGGSIPDHAVGPNDEYGQEIGLCADCREEQARDAEADRRYEEARDRRLFGEE